MLRARLNDDLKSALKAKDKLAVATLRLILAALKDRDIAARGKGESDGVGEEEILELLQKMVRQRRDSIAAYSDGGRQDLAEREAAEIEVIKRFLPKPLDESEVEGAVDQAIRELGASSIKDMGKVIGTLKERYAGRMDFGKASKMVKERLG
jgi:uncharacterized protein YqeY